MPYNPTHYRKTWAALGNPTDPVSFDVAGSQSAISLLKGILAEFGFPFIPDHSISFAKMQQVVGPTVLGRGAGLGDVLALPIGRGLSVGSTLTTTPDVALKTENNFWSGSNAFNGALTLLDNANFAITNQSDTSKVLRFDCSTLPTGNTLKVRVPTVGLEGGPDIGYLGLLKGTGNNFAQPLDDDLSALSTLTAVNTIYYRSQDIPPTWSPVVIGANLLFSGGTLSATGGGGGGGGVNTAGPVNASMLAAFADASGTLIQGVMVSGPGIAYTGGLLQTTNDLRALELLNGTNVLYYRAAPDTWSPVSFGPGLTFAGAGLLALSTTLEALSAVGTIADTVPFFTGAGTAVGTAFTSFGRSLVGTANAAAALTLLGAQPTDGDLTALANLGGTNTIYYRSGASAWSPVTIGANLTFGGGVLAATGGGGGITTSGAVTSAMLTGYADATGNLIRGITMPGAGLTLTGSALTLANDLSALEGLSGTNTIYYRSGVDAWSAVTIGTNLTFAGGILSAAAGGGGVSTSGSVTALQLAGYADASGTLIRGINLPPAGMALSGNNMVLTGDLASLESASATGAIYYRSAADTWSTVGYTGGIEFTPGGTLWINSAAVTPLVANIPTISADKMAYYTGTTTAALTTFTAAARTLLSQPDAASMVGILGAQPLDGDLTSLSGATGTNAIYYRSAANTWSPVVVGTNLTFTGGTLASTGGGGDVFKNLANVFTAQNSFINLGVVIGNTAAVLNTGLETHGLNTAKATISANEWANDATSPQLLLSKSRGTTVNSYTAVVSGDTLGDVYFRGSDGTAFRQAAHIQGIANGTPAAGRVPGAIQLYATNAAGTDVLCASIAPEACYFIGNTTGTDVPAGFVGQFIEQTTGGVSVGVGLAVTVASISLTAGDWDVWAGFYINAAGSAEVWGSISSNANDTNNNALNSATNYALTSGTAAMTVGPVRRLITSNQVAYANVYNPSAAPITAQATISARRRH